SSRCSTPTAPPAFDAGDSPSPRLRGEGRGEGQPQVSEQAAAPHPSPLPMRAWGEGKWGTLTPPLLGCRIAFAGVDPLARAAGALFFFPERCAGLEVVHQKLGRLEGRLAVARGGNDENDVVTGRQLADAMNDETCQQRPPPVGFRLHALKLALGHAR